MSRTLKDKPHRVTNEPWDKDYIMCEGWGYRYGKTTKTKKRKEVDTEDHWMSTPGWWVKMMMTRPERRAAHLQEVSVLKTVDFEEVDFPDLGKKPHVYYW